jgi:hypothetical protein
MVMAGYPFNIELRINRDAVLPAVALIVVHEPPDVGRFDEIGVLVVKLDRALHPAEQLDALGMFGDQGVGFARHLGDERAGRRHPVIFEIAGAAFQAHHDDLAAMLVGADARPAP